MPDEKILNFWDKRATQAKHPGSDDYMLKGLEIDQINEKIPVGASVLDIGCGIGDTLLGLAKTHNCSGVGVDFSKEMLSVAESARLKSPYKNQISFQFGELPDKLPELGLFDVILCQRCLINLQEYELQKKAFQILMTYLKSGGVFLMIESFIQGLNYTNECRKILDLEPIDPPWHNKFLDEEQIRTWGSNEYFLEKEIPFSSTYYFLSRVVYARLARDRGEELRYDSEINRISCKLPIVGNFGSVRLWVWRKS
jgi:ubiquinone/menaquinone biosynthesis C-methylase UbiE